jgi:phage baseplate assembly protein W
MSNLNSAEERLGILPSKRDQYIDFDLTFRRNPVSGDVLIKKDISSINQSIKNILLTNKLEKPFKPRFGGNIHNTLFDLMTNWDYRGSPHDINMQEEIKLALKIHEPRIVVSDVNFFSRERVMSSLKGIKTEDERTRQAQLVDNNTLEVSIVYNVPASEEDISFQFSIKRVR